MMYRLRTTFLLGLICFSFCLIFTADLQAEQLPLSQTIRSASETGYPPFCVVNTENQADGFSVELLRATLDAVGHDVSFQVGPWDEVKQSLIDREVQVLPLVGRTPEREALFDFTFPYMTMHGTIIVRKDENQIHSLQDLVGKKIAVMQGDNAEEFVRRQKLDATITATASFEQALLALSQGRQDAVVIQKLLSMQLIRALQIKNLKSVGPPLEEFEQSFCFAVPKGDGKLLSLLNEGLSIVIADGTSQRLWEKWYAPLVEFDQNLLIVGGDANYPPYEFFDENGRPAGYNIELTEAIARQLNMEVEFQLGSWGEIREKLNRNELDLVPGMFYSTKRAETFKFTDPHTIISHVAIVRAGDEIPQSMAELQGKKIIVMNGDIMHDRAVEAGFKEQLILAPSQEEALKMLSAGQGDCALIARLPAMYWIQKNKIDGLEIGEKSFASLEYCFASHPGKKDLLSRIALALSNLEATGEYRTIHQKWLGVYEQADISYWQIFKTSLFVILPVILLLFFSFLWTYMLKKQVRIKTAALESEFVERKQVEIALFETQKILQAAMDNSPAGIAIAGAPDGKLRYVNDAGLNIRGGKRESIVNGVGIDGYVATWQLHDLDGRPLNPEEVPLARAIMFGETCSREFIIRRGDDEDRIVLGNAAPIRDASGQVTAAIVVFSDISDRVEAEKKNQQLQEELHRAQRIESVGRLAGGVAHDFNNMLSVIIGYADLGLLKVDQTNPLHDNLNQILSAAKRSRDITRQLLAFARKQILAPEILDLNETIESMLKMLRHLIGENINLSWKPQPELWSVKIDPAQIDQILANLCINARDAIADVGNITIETGMVTFDQHYCDMHRSFLPGEYVMLAVSDDGCGMDKETLDNIFEPFFSTKPDSQGTGLGLATVYGTVKQSNGFINVYSEPGNGTTFKIYLQREVGEIAEEKDGLAEICLIGQGETVLVVEDEAMILSLTETMLTDLGYQVLSAAKPQDALDIVRKNSGAIDLLITDVVMPGMNGRQLADHLMAELPGLKCLFMSGYTANIIAKSGVLDKDLNFIHKPFSLQEFSVKIREILDGEQSGKIRS